MAREPWKCCRCLTPFVRWRGETLCEDCSPHVQLRNDRGEPTISVAELAANRRRLGTPIETGRTIKLICSIRVGRGRHVVPGAPMAAVEALRDLRRRLEDCPACKAAATREATSVLHCSSCGWVEDYDHDPWLPEV